MMGKMTNKELGKRLSTTYYPVEITIREFEKGIQIKPVGQEVISLSPYQEQLLYNQLQRRDKRKTVLREV